jgi:predicted metalloprotease with PDZ domain
VVLEYTIDAGNPGSHQLKLTLEFDRAAVAGEATEILLFLPTWTPGSYLLREYSRHLSRVEAVDANTGARLACEKVTKNRYRLATPAGSSRIRLHYSVYAHELSVRTADLTTEHGYWNHACLLLWPHGQPRLQAKIHVVMPAGWDISCGLPQAHPAGPGQFAMEAGARPPARATLLARDLDHAIDSPCLVGEFLRISWRVGDIPHTVVLDGLGKIRPPATLIEDLTDIVLAAASVWGGELPYGHYQFQCLFTADGHGGLEHSESTTLLMSRTALRSEKGYREFLALAAHELFHAWNVKRLRPAEFWNYDYENENYTSLLWLIEGWTAYYDDLLCLRAGKYSPEDYLAVLARSIAAMRNAPGRFRLSLAESSFDAWIRLYRPDENTRNSSQNYYGNGSIAAMCLDLLVRRETRGERCLDDVLRDLYRETYAKDRGYTLADVHGAIERTVGPAWIASLETWTTASLDPDLQELLAAFGIRLTNREANRSHLGITFDAGRMTIASLQADAPAQVGGLAPGDEILALQGLRVDSDHWQDVFQAVALVGEPLEVLIARRGVITQRSVVPCASQGVPWFELDSNATAEQLALRLGWLASAKKASEPAV